MNLINHEFDIFFSYCHENKAIVKKIKDDLVKYNYKVWLDEEEMGNTLYKNISDAITNSKKFLCALSPNYENSDICMMEIKYAKSESKQIYVIKVKDYEFNREVRFLLSDTKYIKFYGDINYDQQFQSLLKTFAASNNDGSRTFTCRNMIDTTVTKLMKNKLSITKPAEHAQLAKGVSSDEFDIFFSYCHKDKIIVFKIKNDLVKNNYKVWLDEDEMGSKLYENITDAITNSTNFLCALSPNYENSKMCMKEIKYAGKQGKQICVVKVKDYKFNKEVDFLIDDAKYIRFYGDLDYDRQFQSLLKTLR